MKKMFNKIKENLGEESLDSALIIAILFPIFLSFIIGGWAFFEAQSTANDVNFDAGRYASVFGCSYDNLQSMKNVSEFSNYTITVNDAQIGEKGTKGVIAIACADPSTKGSEIRVITQTKVGAFGTYFPNYATRSAYFTQEVSGG